MSEYQYYEFQAVDRSLTREQMSELRNYSSRAEITATRFVNVYNYGSFKGNAKQWMERYFDAHLYFANWGTRILMLRIPGRLLDEEVLDPYCTDDGFCFYHAADAVILSFTFDEEEYSYDEEEYSLSSILPVRSGLMRGDLRALYLGWLMAVQEGEVDDVTPEPPLPPELAQLDVSLQSLADFLRIDHDLVTAAAEGVPEEQITGLSREELNLWVSGLSASEKDRLFASLVEGDNPYLAAELHKRATTEMRRESKGKPSTRRTAGEIRARAGVIADVRKREEAERRAREKAYREREVEERRKKYLRSLLGRESDLWAKVEELITTRQPGPYGEAVILLQDLRDLADMTGKPFDFRTRMTELYTQHSRKPSLLEKFRKAKLV
jgi:hypothetical protein